MNKQSKPTLRDIAKELRLNTSTISRALNNHPRISDQTKNAVLRVAKKINYQPNELAAALRMGKSNIIGLVVPIIDRAFYSSIVKIVEEIANKTRYKVMICQSYDLYEKEVDAVKTLLNAQVDGIIISCAKTTFNFDHIKSLQEKGVPLMLFNGASKNLNVNQIMIDDYLGAYKIVTHLIQQGCKRIAHFTSNLKASIYKERLRGYRDALSHYDMPFIEEMVIESDLKLVDGRNSMKKLLQLEQIPDAVFSANDYGVMGAMQILKENGFKIPEQVALAGFGNEKFTAFTGPSLTSVDVLSSSMGNIIAEVIFEQIANSHKINIPRTVILQPKLLIRQSSLKSSTSIDHLLESSSYLNNAQAIGV